MSTTTRRRGEALEIALLEATWVVLERDGYAAFTMEAAAAEAATSKSVIYRRWPTKAELVVAAIFHRLPPATPASPDTGSLRGDVRAYFAFVSEHFISIAVAAAALLAELPGNPQLFETVRNAAWGVPVDVVADILRPMVERAAARGEVPTADLPTRTLGAPLDAARYQLMLTQQPLDDVALDELVDQVALPLYGAGR